MFSNISVLFSAMMIQMIAGQCLRTPYSPVAYTNEIAAASLAAETAALASAATAGIVYGPVAAPVAYAPVFEPLFPLVAPMLTFGLTVGELAASNGGGLRVKSGSPIPPSGVSVESDNMLIEGPLAVSGQLPFLGVVALEGPLPAAGAGAVAYGCGNGNIGIVNEGVAPVAPVAPVVPGYPAAYPSFPNAALAAGFPGPALAPGFPGALAPGFPNALGLAGFPGAPGCAAVY